MSLYSFHLLNKALLYVKHVWVLFIFPILFFGMKPNLTKQPGGNKKGKKGCGVKKALGLWSVSR